jgi:hypothetical protein
MEEEGNVKVIVNGENLENLNVEKKNKNDKIGKKNVWVGKRIIIDGVDEGKLKEGEKKKLIKWGKILIRKINREDGKIV